MASPLSKSTIFSSVRTRLGRDPHPLHVPRRGYHIELGPREKALLEEDPALKKFKSYKNSVKRVSKVGDALTIITVVACAYQIFSVTAQKE
ncbi:putative succinate dehydrogenase subunit 7 [Dioscorea sansibarensis]